MAKTRTQAEALPPYVLAELERLGKRLGYVRVNRDVSLRGVGRLTDGALSSTAVYRIERGERLPSAATLLVLCMAYDCDVKLTRKGTVEIHGTGLHTNGGIE